ncbi:ERF family protein [Fusobacterium necrophorum]|uniref:Recombinase n=1 Tax=Fusobacterium necrophorum subsp. funduliforme TaxID=143387 RepID=A0A161PR28_9FUSO|nr:ERF family protein [Fusobacterium necrophorum]KYL03911.1 hypothetical protein A2J07_10925 [Fusobacterium necrophorum subsp. funduliforme]
MNIYEKLLNVQIELKAPKGQYNKYGNFKYRSCEDILEALKPCLKKHKLTILISDEIHEMQGEIKQTSETEEEKTEKYTKFKRYVKATVTLINVEKPEERIENSAFAREDEIKKGMDGSQITGATSSYARKYALNGLFAIDDTKDSDMDDDTFEEDPSEKRQLASIIAKRISTKELNSFLKTKKIRHLEQADYFDLKKLHDYIFKNQEVKIERKNEIKEKMDFICSHTDDEKKEKILNFYKRDCLNDMTDKEIEDAYQKICKE